MSTNWKLEIISLAKIERMARILDDNNENVFPPRSSSRPRFIILLTSLIPIRLKLRYFILIIGQPKSSILIVQATVIKGYGPQLTTA